MDWNIWIAIFSWRGDCTCFNANSEFIVLRIHDACSIYNDFEEYGSISFLFICPKLENLVLKGNPISYEVEYRPTIFRILPGLKNLDVIMMKRVPKSICKKDKSPNEDDDNEGTASNGIPQQDSDLRELESKI